MSGVGVKAGQVGRGVLRQCKQEGVQRSSLSVTSRDQQRKPDSDDDSDYRSADSDDDDDDSSDQDCGDSKPSPPAVRPRSLKRMRSDDIDHNIPPLGSISENRAPNS